MPVDLGQELGGREVPADHVALQLGHVDPVGGEAAECLVERRGQVAHVEDERRHHRPVARRCLDQVAGEHDEAGGVVLLVLDVVAEDLRVRRSPRRAAGRSRPVSGSSASATSRAAPAVSPEMIGLSPSSRITLRHWPSAWTWLCTVLMVSRLEPGHAHQRELDAQEVLTDDVQARRRQEVVDVAHPAGDGVVDRDHPEIRLAALHHREDVLERRARHRLPVGVVLPAHEVGVGAGLSLVGDPSAAHRDSFPRRTPDVRRVDHGRCPGAGTVVAWTRTPDSTSRCPPSRSGRAR